jgi:hypothetical protein
LAFALSELPKQSIFQVVKKDRQNRCRHPTCLECPEGLDWAGWLEHLCLSFCDLIPATANWASMRQNQM